MLRDEVVIIQMRIGAMDPIDFFALPGAWQLLPVQAPDSFKQSLAAQHLVYSRNAARVTVGGIEERGVCIRDFDTAVNHFHRNGFTGLSDAAAFSVEFHRFLCPDRPMTE